MNLKLELTRQGDDLLLASFGPVCVALWNTKPTQRLFEHQHDALTACVQRFPGRALFLCVVSNQANPPDQDVRDASVRMIRDNERKLQGCACVIEGSGFRAAITRTVLTGMTLVARTPVPTSFFEHVPSATTWLQARTGMSLSGLNEQLENARRRAS